jgi:hypothetical protein
MSLSKAISATKGVAFCKLSSRTPVKAVIVYDPKQVSINDLMDLIKRRDLTPKLVFDVKDADFCPKLLEQKI